MGNAKYMDRHSEVKLLTQVKDRNYTDGKITDYDEEGERERDTYSIVALLKDFVGQ